MNNSNKNSKKAAKLAEELRKNLTRRKSKPDKAKAVDGYDNKEGKA